MKVLFIGTVQSSLYILSKLIEMKTKVVGVVTKKSSPSNADYADLTPLCRENNIPYRYTTDINSQEDLQWMRELQPDIIFCFGFSALLKEQLLTLAPRGVIGFHPAKLPKNRGRHPIIWALALGLSATAVSFFFMDEGADSGDLLSQMEITITPEDDARSLYDKILATAVQQIEIFVSQLETGTNPRIAQDHSLANYWRKRTKDDGRIDFRMPGRGICNLVRALTRPYPGAHAVFNGTEVKVWRVAEIPCEQSNLEPGKILQVSPDSIDVKCADGAVRLLAFKMSSPPFVGEYFS